MTVLSSLALSALLVPGAAPPPMAPSPAYRALVEEYCRGDRARAIQDLSNWSRALLEAERAAIARARRESRPEGLLFPLRAAVMLHTDRDWRDRREAPFDAAAILNEWVAEELVKLLRASPEEESFARRWFLAMALKAQLGVDWEEARGWARKGILRFPDDPRLHLALGSVEEALGTLDFTRGGNEEVRATLLRADRAYREALRLDSGLEEAHLRRGRVAWLLGRLDEALNELVWVRDRSSNPYLLYLAHLFAGRVHEDSGQLTEAVAAYRLALEGQPESQAARVALSHALRRGGEIPHSEQLLQKALSFAGSRQNPDGFWLYVGGQSEAANTLFDELRKESCR
jgi:tetratricopeptide (TPR) repeat protein